MSLTQEINSNNLEIENKNHITLFKTSSLLYSPKLKPEEAIEIPSPLILSDKETISSTKESYPFSDNDILKINLSFKIEKFNVKKRNFSNKNIKKKYEKDDEQNYFFINTKKFKEDKENDNEFNDSINNDDIILNTNNDNDYNLNILNILLIQKLIKGLI